MDTVKLKLEDGRFYSVSDWQIYDYKSRSTSRFAGVTTQIVSSPI